MIAIPHQNRTFLRRHLVPVVVLLVLVGLYHWPVLSRSYTVLDSSPDIIVMEYPDMELRAKALRQGVLPIWDPYSQGGRPMLAQMGPNMLNPITTAFLLFPLSHGHLNVKLFDFYLVVIRFLAGLAAYFLLSTMGLSVVACVFGGFLYAATGITGTTVWPEIMSETIFAPLAFLFLFLSFTGKRRYFHAGVAGAITGLSWFSGTHHVPLITSLTALVMLVSAIFVEKRWREGMLRLSIFGFLLACISAPQLLPSVEMAPFITRWVGLAAPLKGSVRVPFMAHLTTAIQPEQLLGIALPSDSSWMEMGFLGIVALTFITIALGGWSSSRLIRVLAIAALIGASLPVSQYNFLYGILYSVVPAMDKLREPSFWFFLLQISGACLAAIGLDRFLVERAQHGARRQRLIQILLVLGTFLFLGAAVWGVNADPAKLPLVHGYALSGLVTLLFAALFLVDSKKPLRAAVFGGMLIALLFVELGNVSGHLGLSENPAGGPHAVQTLMTHREIGSFLKSRPDLERVSEDPEDVPESLGDLNLVEDMWGHEPTMLTEYFQLRPWTYRARQLYGANYYVAKKPADPRQTLVFSSASAGVNVYSNPGVQPRSWAVHRLVTVYSNDDFGPMLNDPSFDLTQAATIREPAPKLDTCAAPDRVELVSRTWFHSTIDANLGCRGMVILNDNAYPGWDASLDGKSARVYRAYGALRGVVADAGSHRIEFHFRPWSFIIGCLLFAVGILSLFLVSRWDHEDPHARPGAAIN